MKRAFGALSHAILAWTAAACAPSNPTSPSKNPAAAVLYVVGGVVSTTTAPGRVPIAGRARSPRFPPLLPGSSAVLAVLVARGDDGRDWRLSPARIVRRTGQQRDLADEGRQGLHRRSGDVECLRWLYRAFSVTGDTRLDILLRASPQ